MQIRGHHPVRRSLTPLHRRGIPPRQAKPDTPPQEGNCRHYACADTRQPPRQAKPDTPPQEGNCRVQIRGNHPVKRSLTPLQRRGIPPRQAKPDTPPQEGNYGLVEFEGAGRLRLCPHDALGRIYESAPTVFGKLVGTQKTTPSGEA